MAHMQKYKLNAAHSMIAHYERTAEKRGFDRDNIDNERTYMNYNLVDCDASAAVKAAVAEHKKTAGKAVRKDANVLVDWVITMPKDCPQAKERQFFECCVNFCKERYGADNIVGGFVHMDETNPHIHIPIIPVQGGKLQASKVINRADLQTFHRDLGKAAQKALGQSVSIELDRSQKGEKQLSVLNQSEFRAAQRRLERLRQEVEAAESATPSSLTSAKTVYKARGDAEREEVLRAEIEQVRGRIYSQQAENEQLRGRIERLRGRCDEMQGVRERFSALIQRVREVIERLPEVPNCVSATTKAIAIQLNKSIYDPNSLDYRANMARQAASRQHIRGYSSQNMER